MHDYIRGAFQALTWVREIISENSKDPKGLERIKKEIDSALEDIEHGVAIDFRWRLKSR